MYPHDHLILDEVTFLAIRLHNLIDNLEGYLVSYFCLSHLFIADSLISVCMLPSSWRFICIVLIINSKNNDPRAEPDSVI